MKKSIYLVIITISLLIISCEKIIDIDIEDKDKKIVVNGILSTDSLVKVNISKSLSILDDKDVHFINDAIVTLYENDNFIEQLSSLDKGYYSTISFKPTLEKRYKVTVEASGLKSVNAENTIPNTIKINKIDTTTTQLSDETGYSEEKLECSINFTDPQNENNYYYVFAKAYIPTNYDNFGNPISYELTNIFFESDDKIIESTINYGDGIVFSDKLINGDTYSLKIFISKYNFEQDTNKVYFYLNSVSKDFYLYAVSYEKHINAIYDPFVEPVQVYENINNGYGIFTGYSSFVDSITIIRGNNYIKNH